MRIDLYSLIHRKSFPLLVLLAAGLLSFLVYWLLLVRPIYLLDLFERGRIDNTYSYWVKPAFRHRMWLVFGALGFLYWLGWQAAQRLRGRLAWLVVAGTAAACGGVLLLLYPFDAADIFDNIMHGRILGLYAANPFWQTGASFSHDPFYRYMAWKAIPSAYGPLWELWAGGVARLAGEGVIANVLAFKLLAGAFLGGSLLLVGVILRKVAPQRALAGFYLLACNPLVLYETLGNGHNDAVIVFWILAAVLALIYQRYTLAVLALVAGMLFKFIPLLLLPAAIALALNNLPGGQPRLRFLLLSAGMSLVLVAAAYFPFWHGLATLNIAGRTNLFSTSLPAVIFQALKPSLGRAPAAALVSLAAAILTLLAALWLAARASRNASRAATWQSFAQTACDLLLFYLLASCLWLQQWYFLWPLGLVALLGPGRRQRVVAFASLAVLSKQFIVGPVLLSPHPLFPQPYLELYLAIGVLGLPWLAALYAAWPALRPPWRPPAGLDLPAIFQRSHVFSSRSR
jgi:alpha-1,6-mannosyltransferase